MRVRLNRYITPVHTDGETSAILTPPVTTNTAIQDWDRRNILACEALLNWITGFDLHQIILENNAHEMWEYLYESNVRPSSLRHSRALAEMTRHQTSRCSSISTCSNAFAVLLTTIRLDQSNQTKSISSSLKLSILTGSNYIKLMLHPYVPESHRNSMMKSRHW